MKNIGKHVNIVNLVGTCTREGTPLVVLEYARHGESTAAEAGGGYPKMMENVPRYRICGVSVCRSDRVFRFKQVVRC